MAPLRGFAALVLCAALAAPVPATAQTPAQQSSATPSTATSEESSAKREWALGRIRALGEHIAAGRDVESRVRALGRLSEMVCKEDATLARSFFDQALEIGRPLQRQSTPPPPGIRSADGSSPRATRNATWTNLLVMISRCDPDLAFVLRQKDLKEHDGIPENDPLADLTVALDIVTSNPAKAAGLAESAAEGQLTEDHLARFLAVLAALRRTDPQRADELFLRALRNMASEVRASSNRLLYLGNYVFGGSPALETAGVSRSMLFVSVGGVSVISIMATREGASPELAREYLETSLNILSRPSADQEGLRRDYAAAYQMRHKAAEFAPHLVSLFEGLMQRLTEQIPATVAEQAQHLQTAGPPSPAVEAAEFEQETDPERREQRRLSAFLSMIQRKEFTRARNTARGAGDEKAREAMLALADFSEAADAIEKGELHRARELVEKLKAAEMRSLLRAGIGVALNRGGDRDAAHAELLWAQRETMFAEARNRPWLLLALAGALAEVESSTALLAFQQAVTAVNEAGEEATAEVRLITGPVVTGAGRAPANPYLLGSARGFSLVLQYGQRQSSQALRVKDVTEFRFTPALMRRLAAHVKEVEAGVLSLTDEKLRAEALAGVAAAYLEAIPKAGTAAK